MPPEKTLLSSRYGEFVNANEKSCTHVDTAFVDFELPCLHLVEIDQPLTFLEFNGSELL